LAPLRWTTRPTTVATGDPSRSHQHVFLLPHGARARAGISMADTVRGRGELRAQYIFRTYDLNSDGCERAAKPHNWRI
jgi:hypothetical protein